MNRYELVSYKRLKRQYQTYSSKLETISKDFIIWFTGFWEGEGSLCVRDDYRMLSVTQKELYVLERIQKIFQTGTIVKNSIPNKNSWYEYEITHTGQILAVLILMLPHIKSLHRIVQIRKFYNYRYIKNFIDNYPDPILQPEI
jgi:hypothetical protein